MPETTWIEADLATWQPEQPADVLFSNAALHWLGDHGTLFSRLLGRLAPGGVLAAQMPNNFDAPSHTCIGETARDAPWRDRLAAILRPAPVAAPADYHDWLTPHCRALDIWETTYLHVLEGEDPVLNWVKGTALRPLLAALDEQDRPAFEAACAARLAEAYPPRSDGRTLFSFRRLFIVAEV
jgi:trans-aconitate 2-methyltransferase